MLARADIALRALEEAAGAALLLDEALRVVGATSDAERLVGTPIEVGVSAPSLLCGSGPERPVAEALAEGRPITARVHRPGGDGAERVVHVRAIPLGEDKRPEGWLVLLGEEAWESEGPDAPVHVWDILTRDRAMKQLLRDVAKVAQSSSYVLVRGDTGSGKELIAHAIHAASRRAKGPFRAINCAALPANLLESTLFGHVRGAFTGAVRDEPGHFRLADGGTLFLDEVAELPLDLQAKLLRVVQDRSVIPVGGRDPIPVDVRLVSATHRSLRREVAEGRFRADLMYRLRVIPLFLPALRERPKDIALLAEHFVAEFNASSFRSVERIAPGAIRALETYDWPGNIRELHNAIEYAFVMGSGPILTEAELPPEVRGLLDEMHERLQMNTPPELRADLPPEARRLLSALERAGGHHGRAAAALGISRTTLWRRLKKLGIEPEQPA